LLGALYRCRTHFDKIGKIVLKAALVEHWHATFIVTCKFGLAVRLDQITRAYCYYLLSFLTNIGLFGKVYYETGQVG